MRPCSNPEAPPDCQPTRAIVDCMGHVQPASENRRLARRGMARDSRNPSSMNGIGTPAHPTARRFRLSWPLISSCSRPHCTATVGRSRHPILQRDGPLQPPRRVSGRGLATIRRLHEQRGSNPQGIHVAQMVRPCISHRRACRLTRQVLDSRPASGRSAPATTASSSGHFFM